MSLFVVAATSCSAPEPPLSGPPSSPSAEPAARTSAGAVVDVASSALPSAQPLLEAAGPPAGAEPAVAVAYVSEDNELEFLTDSGSRTSQRVALAAIPTDVVADGNNVVVAFPSGDLATIDAKTGRQVARGSVERQRLPSGGAGLIVDELLAASGAVFVVGRAVRTAGEEYFSFVEERDSRTLRLLKAYTLQSRVVQDLAVTARGDAVALLDDGTGFNLRRRIPVALNDSAAALILRYSGSERPWIATAGDRPTLQTGSGKLIPLPDGATPRDLIPLENGRMAMLTASPDELWVLDRDGNVTAKAPSPGLPYAGAFIRPHVYVGSTNDSELRVFDATTGQLISTRTLGRGVVRLAALTPR